MENRLSFCDLVYILSVIELFGKQVNHALNVNLTTKRRQNHKLEFCPYFFTKMSPSEELGTLPSQTEEMLWLLKNVSFCAGGAGRYREEALQELAAHCETQPPASIG